MISLKRILVPHDFSNTSEAALTYAMGLAGRFHATLDVLNVVAEFKGGNDPEHAQAVHQRLMEKLTPDANELLGATFHQREGTPHVEISRFAKNCDVDLIVMGTHGRGFVGHALMGSVAEKVVRTAPCPVLTVHGPPRESVVPSILVALDFEPASDTALTYGRALAHAFGANLHVLHVMENDFLRPVTSDPHTLQARARQRACDRITEEDCVALHATVTVEVSDAPAEAIVQYAANSGIDLIVIGTHGRRGANRLLMGSVAERVVRRSPCPILTVRHPEHEFIWPEHEDTDASTAER